MKKIILISVCLSFVGCTTIPTGRGDQFVKSVTNNNTFGTSANHLADWGNTWGSPHPGFMF